MNYYNFIADFVYEGDLSIGPAVCWWLIITLLLLIMEMSSPGLFFFMSFVIGALCAAGASLLIESIIWQVVVLLVGSVVASFFLRYIVLPSLNRGRPWEQTNVYALKGKKGFVVKSISEKNPGLVKVNQELWAAVPVDSFDSIGEGCQVEVIEVRGAHLRVRKIF